MATTEPPPLDPQHPLALLSGASPEDLSSHPSLASLLGALSLILGPEGQSEGLEQELRQAEAALELQREAWLRGEGLWRATREVLRQPGRLEPPELRALEEALSSAQLRERRPGPPGPTQAPSSLRCRLLPALERRLGEKVSELVDYQDAGGAPPSAAPSAAPSAPSLGLVAALGGEKRRLQKEEEKRSRLEALLGAQQRACLQALCGARALLASLRGPGCEGARAELDRHRGTYLSTKGVALLLRLRLEELSVLLDTYPGPKVEAHRHIRRQLEAALREARGRLPELRAALGALRALGPSFAASAAEYGQLRQRLAQRQWALRQLRPHSA